MLSPKRSALAHPRVCGENSKLARLLCIRSGSSPRVRGKPCVSHGNEVLGGLIPACAGKTECLYLLRGIPPAHPRVCGENVGVDGLVVV